MKWRITFSDGTFEADSHTASSTELIAIVNDSQYRIRVIPIENVVSIVPVNPT